MTGSSIPSLGLLWIVLTSKVAFASSSLILESCNTLKFVPEDECPALGEECGFEKEDNCPCVPEPIPSNDTELPKDLFELLDFGSKELSKYATQNESIILLGNTGSGKSTATQIMAGNLSLLYSVLTCDCGLVIMDEDDKIGIPSTVSKTLIPEMVIKAGNPPLAFFDFPGFDDTRGATHDIAANYFMNQVMAEKVKHIKMLFLVIHSAVELGNDREGFESLAQNAVEFCRNFDKYATSYSLVVTKVDSFKNGRPVTDDKIINGIISFLADYKKSLEDSLGTAEEKEDTISKIKFVTTLMQTKNGVAENIWIVKIPIDCGPLNELEMMVETREKLIQLYQKLSYTEVDSKSDFGFAVKEETRTIIKENYTELINTEIVAAIEEMTTDITSWYCKQTPYDGNLSASTDRIKDHYGTLEQIIAMMKGLLPGNNLNPTPFSNLMQTLWEHLGYKYSEDFQLFMDQKQAYFEFFDSAVGGRVNRNGLAWISPLEKFLKTSCLADYLFWYEFCLRIENKTFSANFHKMQLKLPPQPVNWLDFIDTNIIETITEQHRQVALRMGQVETNLLNNIMVFSLEKQTSFCLNNPNKVLIKGNFLYVQNDWVQNMTSLLARCNTGGKEAQQVLVFATHTVFLEVGFTLKNADLVIISPNWNFQTNNVNLILQGDDGKTQNLEVTNGYSGGQDTGRRTWFATNGLDGKNGDYGKPGGALFGVYGSATIPNNYHPTIKSLGGRGQPGSPGGRGGDAYIGRDTEFAGTDNEDWYNKVEGQYCSESEIRHHYGIQGYNGGDGGKGGKGGEAGQAGNVTLIGVRNPTSKFQIIPLDGVRGDDKAGGLGGRRGRVGKGYWCQCRGCNKGVCHNNFNCHHVEAYNGRTDGRDGQNGALPDKGTGPTPARLLDGDALILNYKSEFIKCAHPEFIKFVDEMHSNIFISPLFTLKILAKESLLLENLDRSTIDVNRLTEMYLSLFRRLNNYYKQHFSSSNLQHQKVMTTLLTSILGSVRGLRTLKGLDIVVDVTGYMDTVVRQMDVLQDIQDRNAMNITIQSEKENFQLSLNAKITQALGYIETIVKPAITQAAQYAEEQLLELELQLNQLILNTKLSLEEAKKELRKQENRNAIYKLVEMFNIATSLMTFFVPEYELMAPFLAKLEDKYADSEDQLEKMRELVKELDKTIEHLNETRNNFKQSFGPMVTSLMEYFANVTESLARKEEINAPELGVTLWELDGRMAECKSKLEYLLSEFLDTKPIIELFDRMQDTMTLATNIYGMVEHYLEQQSLARYIAVMQSAQLGSVAITDPEYAETVSKFDVKLKENLVNQEINKAIHAFKQWIFPFAKFYLTPNTHQLREKISAVNPGRSQVEFLQHELQKYKKMIIKDHDTFIFQTNFSSGIKSGKPFFTWPSSKYKNEITYFLSGESINLNADIRQQGMTGREAVKFKLIEVNLKLNDDAPARFQEELDELLNYFGISMTHNGVSYYRFDQEIFYMTTGPQTILYSFERDRHGNRLNTNMVYEKFKAGDCLLSPYAMWSLHLNNVEPERVKRSGLENKKVGFDSLDKFAPYINIELVGIGTYVDSKAVLQGAEGDLQLEKYYDQDIRLRIGYKL